MKLRIVALAAALFGIASPALAATPVTATFNTSAASTYAEPNASLPFTATASDGSTIRLSVSAWQANQSTGAINAAYLGEYSGYGVGVIGYNDDNGDNYKHQIDNFGGYTDFVLLDFDRAVSLTSLGLNSFAITGNSFIDNDLSYANASGVTASTLASRTNGSFTWTSADGNGWTNVTAGRAYGDTRTINSAASSTKWLISASQIATDRDDAFKLASITVAAAPAVPEPATWAMLIFGFGMIGTMLRAARKSDERFTERMGLIAAGGDA